MRARTLWRVQVNCDPKHYSLNLVHSLEIFTPHIFVFLFFFFFSWNQPLVPVDSPSETWYSFTGLHACLCLFPFMPFCDLPTLIFYINIVHFNPKKEHKHCTSQTLVIFTFSLAIFLCIKLQSSKSTTTFTHKHIVLNFTFLRLK